VVVEVGEESWKVGNQPLPAAITNEAARRQHRLTQGFRQHEVEGAG
jgi:hypothetical protein